MATRTSYLNLIKPDYTDAADIADINANMDTLDNTIQGLDETGSKSLTAHNNATNAHSAMQATVDDTLVPTADLNTIRNLLSNLGNRIKAATGASGWKGDPATTLASLATLVSNLSSGSDVTWSGTKFTNTKLGISGVIDTNGYVAFGPNFGGLIIQWIVTQDERNTWPISFTRCVGVIPSLCVASEADESFVKSVYGHRGGIKFSETGFITWYDRNSNGDVVHDVKMRFFGIGVN